MKKIFYFTFLLIAFVACNRKDPIMYVVGDTQHDTVKEIIIVYDSTIIHDTTIVYKPIIINGDTIHPDTTLSPKVKSGLFSVAPGKYVYFSFGNLQYSPTLNVWRFAEHQIDYTLQPYDPGFVDTYGWADLFPYGYDNAPKVDTIVPNLGSIKYYYSTSTESIDGTSHDWGVSCSISNAENKPNCWRTLTSAEWHYILYDRPNALNLRSTFSHLYDTDIASCLILYPDNYTGQLFPEYQGTISLMLSYENNGCIFIPMCGGRFSSSVSDGGGYYWTSTINMVERTSPECLYFNNSREPTFLKILDVNDRHSVRLVKDIQ